ncbi:peptidoglycan DD-metalloendopeptidase family protein [Methylocella sp.]|uniref:peptidoglycan DD-metalloendopeptidase family protein n=1 Tax=Methylocella sp. TaxID=1978226 RepID=UPI003783580E
MRLALIGVSAGALAGCAGSERLADPFGDPFHTAQATDPAPTSSISPSAGAPVTPVQSRPLQSPVAAPLAPAAPRPVAAAPMAAPAARAAAASGWSAAGGTPVMVAQGDTAETLSRRYGVPADALARANGFSSAAQIQPGSRIVIPVYNAGSGVAQAAPAPQPPHVAQAPAAAPRPAQQAALAPAPTPGRPARAALLAQAKPAEAAVKDAAKKPAPATLTAAGKTEAAAKAELAKAEQMKADATKKLALAKAETGKPGLKPETAKVEAVKTAKVETLKPEAAKVEAPKAQKPEPAKAAKAESAPEAREERESADAGDNGGPEFRWPARGRIIQAFKPGGNEGINIALPEGTSVKAAEGGVVAYAGSELKGYGNLVLIRHPNGFVSAYANNSDIEVKRGDTVKRGQVIARSGQSGNVGSPQLHFELRKGATPVDPTQYLAGL